MSLPNTPHRIRAGTLAIALTAGALVVTPAAARSGGSHHPGSSYGWQGGVSPDLALANVYSGIYGLRYTYDRSHYDFNRCPGPNQAISPTIVACRPAYR